MIGLSSVPWFTAAALAAAVVLAMPQTARAQPRTLQLSNPTLGYTYFSRPGATRSEHNDDLVACIIDASYLQSPDATINNDEGLLGRWWARGPGQATRLAGIENCMVVKGWRVVRLPESEGQRLSTLPHADLARAIETWLGADAPHGEVVRTWDNDAAHASTDRYELRPRATANGSLSVLALGDVSITPPPLPQITPVTVDARWPTRPLSASQIASAPPFAAVIIYQLRGVSMRNGDAVAFARVGPNKDTFPSTLDRAPDFLRFLTTGPRNWRAVVVPPGTWRMTAMGVFPIISFCMGGPAFEVRTGEVVYAGAFDLGAESLGPDLNLEPVRAWLAGQPAADRVRAAEYSNGWTGYCGANALYAIEVEGAPYREGYVWGGASRTSHADGR